MSEIQEAVQIIRVGYEGIEIAMKVGSGGMDAVQKALTFLIALLEREKTMGETTLKKLLLKGGDLQIFQFDETEMKTVKKMAKKYGVLYSVLPDLNPEDGKTEIMFHSEAVPRINMMIQKLNFGAITTFDDYLGNDTSMDAEKIRQFLEEQRMEGIGGLDANTMQVHSILDGMIEKVGLFASKRQSISIEAIQQEFQVQKEDARKVIQQLEVIGAVEKGKDEGIYKVLLSQESFQNRIKGYQELVERVQAISNGKNKDLVDITLNESLVNKENERAIQTRVPGTYGEGIRYLWIPREKVLSIHEGKTILSVLDLEKEYKLYDKDNQVVERVKGSNLYEDHYDPVARQIREKYQKEKQQREKQQKEKWAKPRNLSQQIEKGR